METGLSFSLKYAATEVVHALDAGSKTIEADAAVDVWAIGVIAFELLTEERAFPTHNMSAAESAHAAQEAIAGRVPLPWEGTVQGENGAWEGMAHARQTLQRLEKLRGMRRTVLLCLEREPVKRPTAETLLRTWDNIFHNMYKRGTKWSSA